MKFASTLAALLFLTAIAVHTQQPAQTPGFPQTLPSGVDVSWAFPLKNGDLPPEPEGPKQVPGSSKTYTTKEIDDLAAAVDWFPSEHPPAPTVVLKGKGDALACGVCHLMNGEGHPESASLAGLSAAYIRRQMHDFKSGARLEPNRMNKIAAALSDEEIDQAAEYFASLSPVPGWTKVVEARQVPKTFVGGGRMRFPTPDNAKEAIGARIITVPDDIGRVTKRDPHIGFTAYVPPGSLKRGETLVKTGGNGATIACGTCHGDDLHGLGSIPKIAGLHPIYLARQLYLFKDGSRHGLEAAVMRKPVAKLTDADIVAIAAYVASVR